MNKLVELAKAGVKYAGPVLKKGGKYVVPVFVTVMSTKADLKAKAEFNDLKKQVAYLAAKVNGNN